MDEESRTVWVGNFDSERVTQELLYELFLQAGPLHYVRIPKDRTTGKFKNFAFICFRHSVSVAYAIEMLNGTQMFHRNLKVQSRYLQQQQQSGADMSPGGIHTLDPFSPESPANSDGFVHQSLKGAAPSLIGAQPSLIGAQPNFQNHIITMARQQMALLAAHQPVLLTTNPLLNAHRHRTSDRDGSVNYDRSYSTQRHSSYRGQNRQYDNRTGRPAAISNHTMQAVKSQFERHAEDNSKMLAQLQHQHGRFDYSRLGPPNNSYRQNDDRYHRQSERHDNTSRHQRYSDDHSDQGGFRGHNDRSGRNRQQPYNRSSRH